MLRKTFLLSQVLIFLTVLSHATAASDHWAFLVAGSQGFWNYRHQADVCHAYHVIKKNGISDENIIVMLFDDAASDHENPFKGQLFNKPNGQDVYAGCHIDYSGTSVTPENFLNILKQNTSSIQNVGKVLKSNENSKIFLYFADHGSPGFVAFPNAYLYADQFLATLKYMHENKLYKEMVIYMEACESGSMFEGLLPSDINVYVITAANPHESSWATYCYPDDVVNGQHINTCLGDLFSVNWLEDAEIMKPSDESLESQYEKLLKLTNQSHVQRYGDLKFKDAPVGNFYGNLDLPEVRLKTIFETLFKEARFLKQQESDQSQPIRHHNQHITATDTRDAKLHHLYAVVAQKKSHKAQLDLSYEVTQRMRVDHVFEEFAPPMRLQALNSNNQGYVLPRNFDCLRALMDGYEKYCGQMDEYSLKYAKHFVEACEATTSSNQTDALVHKLMTSCSH